MKPLAGLVAALGLTLPGAAHAQVIPPPAPLPARGVHVSERPGATLVAVTIVIPAGSAEDPLALPGAARLVAETVAQVVRWRIDPDASQLDVRVERGWTAFTLLAAADVWERSWAVLEDALFRLPLGDAPMEAARARLIAGFAFEEGTPVHEFQRELYRTIAGASDPWSRDPRGASRARSPGPVWTCSRRSTPVSTCRPAPLRPWSARSRSARAARRSSHWGSPRR